MWSMGLVRASANHLNLGANRDAKATLNEAGRNAITWIQQNAPLPANVLLKLDAATVDRIFAQPSGQKRINELFRSALGIVIGRAAVATVAQQDDYMKSSRERRRSDDLTARRHPYPRPVSISRCDCSGLWRSGSRFR
jgi:hypothetical protein